VEFLLLELRAGLGNLLRSFLLDLLQLSLFPAKLLSFVDHLLEMCVLEVFRLKLAVFVVGIFNQYLFGIFVAVVVSENLVV